MAHQEFQQAKFTRLEVDLLAGALNRAREQIHFKIANREFGHRRRGVAAAV